jgi:hypothetical protein
MGTTLRTPAMGSMRSAFRTLEAFGATMLKDSGV